MPDFEEQPGSDQLLAEIQLRVARRKLDKERVESKLQDVAKSYGRFSKEQIERGDADVYIAHLLKQVEKDEASDLILEVVDEMNQKSAGIIEKMMLRSLHQDQELQRQLTINKYLNLSVPYAFAFAAGFGGFVEQLLWRYFHDHVIDIDAALARAFWSTLLAFLLYRLWTFGMSSKSKKTKRR